MCNSHLHARGQIAYCEEQVECRRALLLAHFGEAWDPARCQRTCDVCAQRGQLAFQQVWGPAAADGAGCQLAAAHCACQRDDPSSNAAKHLAPCRHVYMSRCMHAKRSPRPHCRPQDG